MTDKNKYISAAKELLKTTRQDKLVFEVVSNSMSPLIKKGDRVAIEKYTKDTTVRTGDIVAFKSINSQTPTIHRVIKIAKYGDIISYVTKGDANPKQDEGLLFAENIIGSLERIIKPKGTIELNSPRGKVLNKLSYWSKIRHFNLKTALFGTPLIENESFTLSAQCLNTPFEIWERSVDINMSIINTLNFRTALDISGRYSQEALLLGRLKSIKIETDCSLNAKFGLVLCTRIVNALKGNARQKLYKQLAESCALGGHVLISWDNYGKRHSLSKCNIISLNSVYVKEVLNLKTLIKHLKPLGFKAKKIIVENYIISVLLVKW